MTKVMTKRCLIPKWALWMMGAALVPWGIWVTHTLIVHDVENQVNKQRLERLENKP